MASREYDVGMIGIGVMGANLVLNIADHGFSIVVYDAAAEKTREFIKKEVGNRKIKAAGTLRELAGLLRRPRAVILLVPAGTPVDAVIGDLMPYCEPGDLFIDGGNSHFTDTNRREKAFSEKGLLFMGMGVSGGEYGARHGPSLMPGGPREDYERVRPILQATAAQVNGDPCVMYLGSGSAGWWAEAYAPEVGWALGGGREHDDDPAWDAVDADALYDLLEREVIPEFYARDESGIPTAWIKRMRESMARLTPHFSANRAVREYTEQHYLPAAAAYHLRIANKAAIGRQIVEWQHTLEQKWATLHFGEVKVETRGEQQDFEVQVYLNDLDPNAVRVELYADGIDGSNPVRQEMKRGRQLVGAVRGYMCSATLSAIRPVTDYTARVIPNNDSVAVPLEAAQILWQPR